MREGWVYKKLGEVSVNFTGSRPSGGVGSLSEGALSLGGEHIGRDGHLILNKPKYVSLHYYNNSIKGHIKKHDILLCKDGALTGKVAFVENELGEIPAMINEHVFIIRTELINQKYLFRFLFSPFGQSSLTEKITGTAQGGLNGTNLKKIEIPIPPLNIQQQIVSELDLLSHILEQKRQQMKEYDALAESIFYEMFGDPVENPKGWELKKLGDLFKVTSSKRILQEEWSGFGVPFLKVADLVSLIDGKKLNPSTFIPEAIFTKLINDGNVPKEGDILVTSRGTIGHCYIVKSQDRFYFQDGMITWLSKNRGLAMPIYIVKLFQNKVFLDKITNCTNKSTVSYLSIGQMSNIEIPLPSLSLQQIFAAKIQSVENQKQMLRESIKETETLFQSRMDYWFNS